MNNLTKSAFFGPHAEADKFELHATKINSDYMANMATKENWLLNPSYQSGKIKNLAQYEFRLNPEKNEHDMIGIPKRIEWAAGDFTGLGESIIDDKDLTHLMKHLIDTQFDAICIKIQGVATSRYLIHCVDNVEFQCREDSPSAIYQTECCDLQYGLKMRQLEFKKEERLPGKIIGGPRNS